MTGAMLLAASTIGLASPADAAVGTLDQSTSAFGGSRTSLTNDSLIISQSFTAGLSGNLSQIDVYIEANNGPTSVLIGIKAADGTGLPTGPMLSSEILTPSGFTNGIVSVVFTNPAVVTANSSYTIVLSCTGCGVGSMFNQSTFTLGLPATDYLGGLADRSDVNPHPWGGGGVDLVFATYVSPASVAAVAGPLPADVLQHVGLPKSGSCADVDDSKLNWAGVKSGGWTASWAQWANNGSGGAICGRTLRYAPSGRWVSPG
jgi:hypothetical protein